MKNFFEIIKNIWSKGFFHVLAANVFIALFGFGAQLFVAKILTEEELGYIKVFQSFIQILSIIAGMGFSTAVLVLVANPKNEYRKSEIIKASLLAVAPISVVVWLLFVLLNQFNVWTKINTLKILFDRFSFVVFLTAYSALFTAFVQSMRDFRRYSTLIVITKILCILLIILFTSFGGMYGFMIGLFLGLLASLVVNFVYAKRFFVAKSIKVKGVIDNIKEQLAIGIYGLGANLFSIILMNLDVIILSYYLADEPRTLGQYCFAAIFITALNMIQGTIVSVSVPYFSKHIEDRYVVEYVYKKYSIILFAGSTVLFCFIYTLLPPFILLAYGEKFEIGIYFLKFLLGIWLFRLLNAINIAYFLSSGNTNLTSKINFLSIVLAGAVTSLSLIVFNNIELMLFSLMLTTCIMLFYSTYIAKRSMAST